MTKQENNDDIIIIKKYANRRLYNTATSSYIILEDLFVMIKNDQVFEVIDAKTEENITKSVLTQIIFEQEAKGYNLLSTDFLRQLISLYGNSQVHHILPNYLQDMIFKFSENSDKFMQMSLESLNKMSPIKFFENMQKKNIEIFKKSFGINDKKDD